MATVFAGAADFTAVLALDFEPAFELDLVLVCELALEPDFVGVELVFELVLELDFALVLALALAP
ncbi:hypothetical protein [Rhodopseudomonas faecalis]|uniref:hypothetical protein n=1 Tax=Rhodopseudomonas TaxID=1073 RepID=UPI0004830B26